jgi:uncharacterized protein
MKSLKRGFTVIEILVVVAIVAILLAIIISSVNANSATTGNTTGTDSSLQSTTIPGQSIPTPTGYVNDEAGVLSAATVSANETKLTTFASSGSGEVAVLIVPSLNGLSIEEYGIRVGEAWKVGKYGQDNGNILIISTGDRKVRIETGSGSNITDAQAAQIISTALVPHLKNNDWDGAVTAGVDAITHQMVSN